MSEIQNNSPKSKFRSPSFEPKKQIQRFGVWLLLGTLVGIPVGLASAIFLYLLDFITQFRETNLWVIAFLPLVGLLIGFMYKKSGDRASSGNNLKCVSETLPVT